MFGLMVQDRKLPCLKRPSRVLWNLINVLPTGGMVEKKSMEIQRMLFRLLLVLAHGPARLQLRPPPRRLDLVPPRRLQLLDRQHHLLDTEAHHRHTKYHTHQWIIWEALLLHRLQRNVGLGVLLAMIMILPVSLQCLEDPHSRLLQPPLLVRQEPLSRWQVGLLPHRRNVAMDLHSPLRSANSPRK